MKSNTAQIASPWLTTEQAAEYLGIGPRLLSEMRATNTGPTYRRVGVKLVRYHRDALDAWMEAKARR